MTTVLVATASVHTTAAACDYLGGRLGDSDRVVVLGVAEPGLAARDVGDAANVARTRLVEQGVEVLTREGEPADEIATVADERDVDEVVVGATRGDPEAAGEPPGSTVRALLTANRWPVVVLPSLAP
jgi:nucleotide-binding universal stress UspA family protein